MRISSSAVEVVNAHGRLYGRLPRGEYSTGHFPTIAVDSVAVKSEQGPTQQKHDQKQWHESNNDICGAPFESVSVLNEMFGKNKLQRKSGTCATLFNSSPTRPFPDRKAKVDIAISFDRESGTAGDAQFEATFSKVDRVVCLGRHVSRLSTIVHPGLVSYLPSKRPIPHSAQTISVIACHFGFES